MLMCRICMTENVRMYPILHSHLQDIFENLTLLRFQMGKIRPLQVCYICRARLQSCYMLKMSCLQSEDCFAHMMKGLRPKLQNIPRLTLSLHSAINLSNIALVQEQEITKGLDGLVQVEVKQETVEDPYADVAETESQIPNEIKFSMKKGFIEMNKKQNENSQIPPDNDNAKLYKCRECSKLCSNKSGLIQHIRIHTGEKPYQCDICDKRFNVDNNLKRHIRVHTGEKPYKCNVCNKSFAVKFTLTKHFKIHNKNDVSKAHPGEILSMKTKKYECNTCNKSFSCRSHLVEHIRIHTGEKPHICHLCDKRFSAKSQLRQHSRTHDSDKPYKCEQCKKCFKSISHLIGHKHIHKSVKPYRCNICDKRFARGTYLKIHKRLHTGEKPFKCELCNKCYGDKGNLKSHYSRRHGDKAFEKYFNNFKFDSELKNHVIMK